MAERITELSQPRKSPGRPSIYPWERWMDGSVWRIKRAEDFELPARNMMSILRRRATDKGVRVSVRVVDESTVEFQFYPWEMAA